MSYIYGYALFEGALNQFAKTVCFGFPEKVINNDVANGMKADELIRLIRSENGIEELVEFRIRKKSKNDLLEIKETYKDYSFKKLFEESVKYTLSDCCGLPFYKIKNGKYTLDLENCKALLGILSGGERYVLGWWMYLYSDTIGNTLGINIMEKVSFLDEETKEKIRFIKDFGRRFPFVLDGQNADY